MIGNILKFFWKSVVGLLLIVLSFMSCCAKYKVFLWIAAVVMFLLDLLKYFTAKKAQDDINKNMAEPRKNPYVPAPPKQTPVYGPALPPIPYAIQPPYTGSKPPIAKNTFTNQLILPSNKFSPTITLNRQGTGYSSMGAFN